jgi:hypothetical protein
LHQSEWARTDRRRRSSPPNPACRRKPTGTLPATAEAFGRAIVVPKLVAEAGDKAARRYANFFGSIENDNTRAAYSRACASFFAWCEAHDIADLVRGRAVPRRRFSRGARRAA